MFCEHCNLACALSCIAHRMCDTYCALYVLYTAHQNTNVWCKNTLYLFSLAVVSVKIHCMALCTVLCISFLYLLVTRYWDNWTLQLAACEALYTLQSTVAAETETEAVKHGPLSHHNPAGWSCCM